MSGRNIDLELIIIFRANTATFNLYNRQQMGSFRFWPRNIYFQNWFSRIRVKMWFWRLRRSLVAFSPTQLTLNSCRWIFRSRHRCQHLPHSIRSSRRPTRRNTDFYFAQQDVDCLVGLTENWVPGLRFHFPSQSLLLSWWATSCSLKPGHRNTRLSLLITVIRSKCIVEYDITCSTLWGSVIMNER